MKTLNLGAGNAPIFGDGAVNHDIIKHRPEIDVVWDLNELPWPWGDDSFDLIIAKAVFEHLRNNLVVTLDECWRILRPDGKMTIKLPHWEHERSHRDPTHVWPGFTVETLHLFDPEKPYGRDYSFYTERKWKCLDGPKLSSNRGAIWATMAVRT